MSNSTPQGPGPQFGSNPDASPIDETEAVTEAMDEESAGLSREGADDVIDISDAEGPEISGGDDVDPGSA
ncbi:hypothetical protein [uncultured Amnibacterium sp.]|uniref:hypothetical protein n=1 Tax=uncultured Amnibacterium sp. TaxID=1631851 RepID=UPI0035CB2853